CEELDRLPRHVALETVVLDEHGALHARAREASTPLDAERALRDVLARLLEVASSPGPALVRAASRAPAGNVATLAFELEKALVPLNRTAAQRALLRLYRETERARHEGRLADVPENPAARGPEGPRAPELSRPVAMSQSEICSPIPPNARVVPTASDAAARGAAPAAPRDTERTPPMGTLWVTDAGFPPRDNRPRSAEEAPGQERPGTGRVSPYPDPPARRSDIEELMRGFEVAEGPTREEVCIELKRLAGVEGTPDPGDVAERQRGGKRREGS